MSIYNPALKQFNYIINDECILNIWETNVARH